MSTVQIISILGLLYAVAGLAHAILFYRRAAPAMDGAVPGSSTGFVVVTLPGVVALWPVLLLKSRTPEGES